MCGLPIKGIGAYTIENELFSIYMANNSHAIGLDSVYSR